MEHKTLLLNQSDINSLITMKDIVEIVDNQGQPGPGRNGLLS